MLSEHPGREGRQRWRSRHQHSDRLRFSGGGRRGREEGDPRDDEKRRMLQPEHGTPPQGLPAAAPFGLAGTNEFCTLIERNVFFYLRQKLFPREN
jgi:hypothetical protein